MTRSTLPPRTTVDGTGGERRSILDHRSRFDEQHLALDQALGDGVPGPRQDPCIRLSRHTHPLGRCILIQPFQIGEPHRFELVQADGDPVRLARRTSDGPESATSQLAADAAGNDGARHPQMSICS
jgi:hypothetical protein